MGERPPVQDDRPLVSVITPTVGDSTNLRTRCIPSVISQTYSNIEHIIVCDGPSDIEETNTPIQRVVHLGRNWHSFTRPHPSWGTMARLVGSGLARGQYIAYNDHDDELDPQHVEKLVDLLESTDSDWSSPRWRLFTGDSSRVRSSGTVSRAGETSPPRCSSTRSRWST